MDWLFRSGHAVDLVLLVMLAEGIWLALRRAVPVLPLMLALLPGAFILLAARAALTGAPWPLIALPLALSFPVHLWDLKRRGWW